MLEQLQSYFGTHERDVYRKYKASKWESVAYTVTAALNYLIKIGAAKLIPQEYGNYLVAITTPEGYTSIVRHCQSRYSQYVILFNAYDYLFTNTDKRKYVQTKQ